MVLNRCFLVFARCLVVFTRCLVVFNFQPNFFGNGCQPTAGESLFMRQTSQTT